MGFVECVQAIVQNEATWQLAELIPPSRSGQGTGGRPRKDPACMHVVFACLLSKGRSQLEVEAQLASPFNQRGLRQMMLETFPDDETRRWPDQPMSRYAYSRVRDQIMGVKGQNGHATTTKEGAFEDREAYVALRDAFEAAAAAAAQSRGLGTPTAKGTFTEPDLPRLAKGDGTTIKARSKAKKGDLRSDGVEKRRDLTAREHTDGAGEIAFGNKFSILSIRNPEQNDEIILAVEAVGQHNEMASSVAMAKRSAAHFHKLQEGKGDAHGPVGWIYDGSCRGVHQQELMTVAGWLTL